VLYFYIVAAVGLVPILDNFMPILRESYSWWLTPVAALAIFLIFLIIHFGILVIYIQCINLDKPVGSGSSFLRKYIDLTLPIFYKLARAHVHTTGIEKIPDEKRVLLVCNHRDNIDPVIILGALPELELGFIAKKEVYTDMRFVAKALHKLNGLPIDRENDRKAAETVINAIKTIKEDKASIGVFPEGYTNLTEDELLPLRNGVFKIAQRAKVPIVVCTIYNSPTIFKRMFRRRSDVYLDVAEVISEEQVQSLHTDAIGEKVTQIMLDSLEKRKNSIEKGTAE
jgi:1-acyl-sn-glycerol-3-phosphate acyltransferase